jgi:Glycosyl hydrolases family 25
VTLAGVDVSSYQGGPGTWHAEAGAIDWAGVKITELAAGSPTYVNPDAAADWAWLGDNHKGRVGYLFGHPAASAADTAEAFLAELRPLGFETGDMVCLDIELTEGHSMAAVAAWCLEVLTRLEEDTGCRPVLYCDRAFAGALGVSLHGFPLWVSDPDAVAGHPAVPAPWKTWALHQYVITGPIDRDVANYTTLAAMRAELGKPAPAKPAAEETGEPMLATGLKAKTIIMAAPGSTAVWFGSDNHLTGAPAPKLRVVAMTGGKWGEVHEITVDGSDPPVSVPLPASTTGPVKVSVQRADTGTEAVGYQVA